uniref:Uncharacterized protein n=1 Tax=Mimiviridae sp. ChoanoV1 TaxID=2596887 RepID=A0A5B8IDD1_9VIRU|nr:hypothetical protein 1_121 [Mimiviridae sp. ChoanoV1]
MRSKMRGGSKASNLVMSTNSKLCGDSSPILVGKGIDANVTDAKLYSLTGGRKLKRSNKQSNKISNKRSNRKLVGGDCGGCGCSASKKQFGGRNNKRSKSIRKRKLIGGENCGNHSGKKNSSQSGGRKIRKSKSYKKRNFRGGGVSSKRKFRGGNKHAGIKNGCGGNQTGGGASDWRSTVYSRGPVNQASMNPDQFRMFADQSKYLTNAQLTNNYKYL